MLPSRNTKGMFRKKSGFVKCLLYCVYLILMLSFSLHPGGLFIVERDISEFTKLFLGVIFQLYPSLKMSQRIFCLWQAIQCPEIFFFLFWGKTVKNETEGHGLIVKLKGSPHSSQCCKPGTGISSIKMGPTPALSALYEGWD